MEKFRLGLSTKVSSIGIRVKNRDKMIHFYRDIIGFSLIREENALAIMGTDGSSVERFYLEESPRADAHFGTVKKLNHFVIQVNSIEELQAIELRLKKFTYENFTKDTNKDFVCLEIIDPEENCFIVMYETKTLSNRLEEDKKEFSDESVRLAASFHLSHLQINALNLETQQSFLTDTLGFHSNQPIVVTIVETDDPIAAKASHEVAGLEFIRLSMEADDFNQLASHLLEEEQSFYLDKKQTILTIEDSVGVEWWFDKVSK